MSKPAERGVPGLWWLPATVVGVAAVALGWARYVEPRRLELSIWDVPLEGLATEAETSVLHLSDLHVTSMPLSPQQLIAALGASALSCPVLCLTGDFCDRPSEIPQVEAYLAPILHAMAVQGGRAVTAYAVWGNHDRKAGQLALAEVMQHLGITVLNNAATEIGGGLWVAGVGDPTTRQDRLEQAIAAVPPGRPFLLLAHNPSIFGRAAAAGVPLTLAGHTHGGQVRLGGLERLADRGGHGARPYRGGGWYRHGGQAIFVNRGLGTTFLPMRFGARPEAAIMRLRCEHSVATLPPPR